MPHERLLSMRCGIGRCLERWLCEGVLDDPFAEFMIQENPVRVSSHVSALSTGASEL